MLPSKTEGKGKLAYSFGKEQDKKQSKLPLFTHRKKKKSYWRGIKVVLENEAGFPC